MWHENWSQTGQRWRWINQVQRKNPRLYSYLHSERISACTSHHRTLPCTNLAWGVAATTNKVRQKYWVPRLRSMVKSARRGCNYCKKYRATVLNAPPSSALPKFRTELTEPFNVTGVDFAGPLLYRSGGRTGKAYVALFTCASTRAVHLTLWKDMTAKEFKRGLKEFVVRRGAPDLLVSDNTNTFQAMKKWLSTLQKDENIFNCLATKEIGWKFNMSRAPWWGGFFERLIAMMKNALSKATGWALLRFEELEEVLLDVESFLNNRPLCYITPNLLHLHQIYCCVGTLHLTLKKIAMKRTAEKRWPDG